MDPTETLRDIREVSLRLEDTDEPDVVQLIGDVAALDDWIGRGGFLPDQWRNVHRGRPRLEQDGRVLSGVNHGTRHAYNTGCRCAQCRQANREAAVSWRNRKKGLVG